MIFLGSSVVEQTAVNRSVAGSNPARGAIFHPNCAYILECKFNQYSYRTLENCSERERRAIRFITRNKMPRE
jgi:hypothetical protein